MLPGLSLLHEDTGRGLLTRGCVRGRSSHLPGRGGGWERAQTSRARPCFLSVLLVLCVECALCSHNSSLSLPLVVAAVPSQSLTPSFFCPLPHDAHPGTAGLGGRTQGRGAPATPWWREGGSRWVELSRDRERPGSPRPRASRGDLAAPQAPGAQPAVCGERGSFRGTGSAVAVVPGASPDARSGRAPACPRVPRRSRPPAPAP